MRNSFLALLVIVSVPGIFSCKNSKNGLSKEIIAADSLAFEMIENKFADEQFSSDPAIQSKYNFTYFHLKDELPVATRDSILAIQATFLSGSEKKVHVLPDFKQQAQEMFNEFAKNAAEFNPFAGWEMNRAVTLGPKLGTLQSVECSEMSYMGGAHPNAFSLMYVIDLANGKTVHLQDIVSSDQMSAFNKLRFEIFLDKWNANGEDLNWKDYFFAEAFNDNGDFYSNENFYVGKEGITFYYNQYEIAPYSSGVTELTIPLEKLKPFLNPKGPYYSNFETEKPS